MENVQSSLALASQLVESGQVKDAYLAYLSLAEQALKSLYDVRFVHSSIVSRPKNYPTSMSTLNTCITHIDTIIEKHTTVPMVAPRPTTTTTPLMTPSSSTPKTAPPPLPPKPSRIQKPSVPPKPVSLSRPASPTKDSTKVNQHHPSYDSISVPGTDTLKVPTSHYHQHYQPLPPTPSNTIEQRPLSAPQQATPPTTTTDTQNRRPRSEYPNENNDDIDDDLIDDGTIDPTHLVPAQSNAGDSLSPPTSTALNTDHIPFIPVPPLLSTHRTLQARLDELEITLKEYKGRKQRLLLQQEQSGDYDIQDQEIELDRVILQYTGMTAEVKQTLNRVRTLYMTAATIPTVLQFPPYMIAYQATLIEAALFYAIPPRALLEHSAKHPHPRIVASTDFFNYLTRVIEHNILLPQEASSRAQQINHWIKVAVKCLELNNYQTLKAIVSALGTPPVQRLRRTWAYIPKKSMGKLDGLNELMSENDNYGQYRTHMGMVSCSSIAMSVEGGVKSVASIRAEHYKKPTVPFLGTFIHDMTYLIAATPNTKTGQLADDPRIHEILHAMEMFQKGPRYTMTPPAWYLKASQKHHHLRSGAISSALQRSASGISRFSGGMFGLSSSSDGDDESVRDSILGDEDNMDEQQQMITQYLLMRSWVNQNTVDELSMLREPPRQMNTCNATGGGTSMSRGYSQHRSTTGSNYNTNSMVSTGSSSLMRFSTGSVSMNGSTPAGSRGTSMEEYSSTPDSTSDEVAMATNNKASSSFWPFRRSTDTQRPNSEHQSSSRNSTESRSLSRFTNIDTGETNSTQSAPSTAPPHIPPRPPPRRDLQPNNDEFKNALTNRLQAHVAGRQS
ncbi:ras GEF [Lichtheimia hyalospora FSU 10163]|nr:ras GEF [Lichtheimia hyalospora FSU 10163]